MDYLCAEEVGLNCRVPKRINLPADPWDLAELLLDESVPQRGLINHVNVVHGRLVVHAHAPISSASMDHKEGYAISQI